MARGDMGLFEELFAYGCPKFVVATPPSYDAASATTNHQAYVTQLNLFKKEASVGPAAALPLPRPAVPPC